ncbi:hypothetical protein CIL03_04860 [Virgibacillus indicus]|uniref:Uncharacterized protein n=1 Tax=Virgibacillus indicus TaxID=2024554 RepID=A0A265NEK0_9BACI|nr:hypothetical protein [Virgibacillus indicus]OZU90480.1 hypothetical protein CIL03_04860 [Virgibacillus indicus]
MTELKEFIYELQRYANQTHILRDHYEKLSESEKKLVMEAAPESLKSPREHFQPVFTWLENVHDKLGITHEE